MNTLSEYHDKVQKQVVTELKHSGYEVLGFVYHNLNKDKIEQLRNCVTPECMFIRTLPDLLAVKDSKSMFLEIKSKSPQYENLALELFPLMVNYYLEMMGLNIMYVYGYEDEQGRIKLYYLPTKEIIKLVHRVIITDKFDERMNRILEDFSKRVLRIDPEKRSKGEIIKRKTLSENVGSADPYVLIQKENLNKFREFKELTQYSRRDDNET